MKHVVLFSLLTLASACGSIVEGTGDGSVDPPASGLSASPNNHTFEDTEFNNLDGPETITVTNVGETEVTLLIMTDGDDGDFIVSSSGCAGVVLAPSASCDFAVTFAPATNPQSPGTRDMTVRIEDETDASVFVETVFSGTALEGEMIPDPTLTVTTDGSGSGTVSRDPEGDSGCGADCRIHDAGNVTLTAQPNAGSVFTGWTLASCEDSSLTCVVPLTSNATVGATFEELFTLDVSTQPANRGTFTVNPSPPGGCQSPVSCTNDAVVGGSGYTIQATPLDGFSVTGWHINGILSSTCGTSLNCSVQISGDTTVIVNFGLDL